VKTSKTASAERLEGVFRAEADRLWRALVLQTNDREAAADAVSEAFAQALRRGDAVVDPARWVWKTAFLIARRAAAEERVAGELADRSDDDPAPELVDLVRALGRLTPHQRASIVLHHYAGYSLREVAEIIGSTRAAVGVHLFRGREKLRKALEVEHG
jgi:RNA polymerase sigma-70 factor (ECF subfamily)